MHHVRYGITARIICVQYSCELGEIGTVFPASIVPFNPVHRRQIVAALRALRIFRAWNSRCQDYYFVDVIRDRAVSDLRFVGKTWINKDSFLWGALFFFLLCFAVSASDPSNEDETSLALYPAVISLHFHGRFRFSAGTQYLRTVAVLEAFARPGESRKNSQEVSPCMAVCTGKPQDTTEEHRAGWLLQSAWRIRHQVRRQHPPGELPTEVRLLLTRLTMTGAQGRRSAGAKQVHEEA